MYTVNLRTTKKIKEKAQNKIISHFVKVLCIFAQTQKLTKFQNHCHI